MRESKKHVSDQELLLAADGELNANRSAEIRRHLEACPKCHGRMAQIESAMTDFVHASRTDGPELPPIAESRARLRAELAALSIEPSRSSWWRPLFAPSVVAYALAAVVLVLAGRQILERQLLGHLFHHSGSSPYAAVLPNPTFTPGATRPISLAQVCSSGRGEVVTPVSRREQRRVFEEYGITNAPAKDYEVDYLITPDLGGADDIRNLWPEPHQDSRWNSYAKDQLEDQLHRLVCSGKLSLAAAQEEISNNWIVAYQKYLQAGSQVPGEVPQPSHGTPE